MRVIVAHPVPSPQLRNATTKLHTASMTESNSPGRSLPSWRPMIVGKVPRRLFYVLYSDSYVNASTDAVQR